MFIAHHLITLDKCLRIKLTPPSSRASTSPLSGIGSCCLEDEDQQIADLVPVIKSLGNDSFTEHIREKTSQLCQTLHDAGGEGFIEVELINKGMHSAIKAN